MKKLKKVEIVSYNPEWKNEFEKIKAMLYEIVGDIILKIEHVGSTSVEGLAAKPIIDLDVVIDNEDDLPMIIERLKKAGFEHQGNLGVPGRDAFKRTYNDEFMKYHLYVCPQDGKGYLEHIAFRDYLIANPSARDQYQQLKIDLANKYSYDIDSYCNQKTEFVQGILLRTEVSKSVKTPKVFDAV